MIVLLVDSNAEARTARATAMRAQGWQVQEAASAAAGMDWLAGAAALDALVSEAVFDASTTGFGLRDKAKERFPAVQTLFTTRYDLAGFETQVGDTPVVKDKPISAEELVARVAELAAPGIASSAGRPALLQRGVVVGNNQILERLYVERETETYRALQRMVQRKVALVLLKPEFLAKPEVVSEFKERERIKASVSHPRIAPLYEAGQDTGWHFYTREIPAGRSLEEVIAAAETLTERALVDVLHGIADAMTYITARGYGYRMLGARDIYLDTEHQSSIVNIVRPAGSLPRDQQEDVRALLALLRPVVAEGKARGLLHALAAEEYDWAGLLQELDTVREAMRERSIMRKAGEEELTPATSAASNSGTHPLLWAAAAAVLAAAALLGGFAGKGHQPPPKAEPAEMVWIPPGEFVYQQGERRQLPGFAISKYEITIGQYAAFLEALKTAKPGQFDHPDQPASKTTHEPEDWAKIYAAAAAGGTHYGETISLKSPITRVDWWDAQAYANWKGQRLPTEEEWERAARGEQGLPYPWGAQAKPDAANLGDDYDSTATKGGEKDGYNLWAPVDALESDATALGVIGMAGNVEEWTATRAMHPELVDERVPVVRGGRFDLKSSDQLLTRRSFPDSAEATTLARGFRTASNVQPAP